MTRKEILARLVDLVREGADKPIQDRHEAERWAGVDFLTACAVVEEFDEVAEEKDVLPDSVLAVAEVLPSLLLSIHAAFLLGYLLAKREQLDALESAYLHKDA